MLRATLPIVLTLALAGCSDPLSTTVPGNVAAWDGNTELQDAAQTLDAEEQRLLTAYALRRAFGGPGVDLPLREVLADQRAFEVEAARRDAEAAAVAARVAAAQEAAQAEMHDAVTVAVARFQPRAPDFRAHRYGQDILITVGFANRTDRPIRAVRGTLHFVDSFGAPIKRVGITYEGGVAPGATAAWDATLDINQFIAEDVKLFTADPAVLQVQWEPTGVLFADGTLLSAEVR